MEQGLSAQGFQVPRASSAAQEAEALIARASRRTADATKETAQTAKGNQNAETQGGRSATEIAGQATALYGEVASVERKTQGFLSGIQSKIGMLGFADFIGMGAFWVASKLPAKLTLPKFATVMNSVMRAPFKAMHATENKNFTHMPANFMQEVANQASAHNLDSWAKSATEVSQSLARKGNGWSKSIGKMFEGIKGSGVVQAMPSFMKKAATSAGGLPIFGTLMGAAALVGITATMFGTRAEKKETNAAIDELMADFGGDKQGAFVKAMRQAYASNSNWRPVKAAVESVGGVADSLMWLKPGLGGAALMGGMVLPQMCAGLVPNNPVLGAYIALKRADQGKLTLDVEARTTIVKQLIAVMPNVAANGGQYNRLVAPMAKELMSRKMNAVDIGLLLNNETAFTQFSQEIFAKQQAAAKPVSKDTRAPVKEVAQEMKVDISPQAANAPKFQVAGTKMHHGTVAANQLQVG